MQLTDIYGMFGRSMVFELAEDSNDGRKSSCSQRSTAASDTGSTEMPPISPIHTARHSQPEGTPSTGRKSERSLKLPKI